MASLGFIEILLFLVVLAAFLIPPFLCALIARQKGVSVPFAIVLGLCLSWIGLVIVAAMQPGNPPEA